MIITIDGPAGSGKSTAARELATALHIAHLDTGATYRAVTLRALRLGIDLADDAALTAVAREADIRLEEEKEEETRRGGDAEKRQEATASSSLSASPPLPLSASSSAQRVLLDGQDVTREIRSIEVTEASRYAAKCQGVREVLVDLQRKIGRELGSFVTEGRDQGSVVFPDADAKFYLDARPEVRARRRCDELNAAGEKQDAETRGHGDTEKRQEATSSSSSLSASPPLPVSPSSSDYAAVLEAIIQRDRRDSSRSNSPLVRPAGAIVIDTSDNTVEQTLAQLLAHVEAATK